MKMPSVFSNGWNINLKMALPAIIYRQALFNGKWKCVHERVFICSASLCLLIGAFNPFTFKVIIGMYDLITIFLIVLGLFSVGRTFPSLVFCLEKFFSICCKAGLVVLNSVNFCLSEKLLICPSNLKESLAR